MTNTANGPLVLMLRGLCRVNGNERYRYTPCFQKAGWTTPCTAKPRRRLRHRLALFIWDPCTNSIGAAVAGASRRQVLRWRGMDDGKRRAGIG